MAQVLRRLPHIPDDDLLVGTETRDDAAVYRMGRAALVFTADFFAPVVDDPYDFGRIAATNALSDVYAMGGEPMLALNLLACPAKLLGPRVIARILRGGADACREAGATVGGGHSVEDPEPKFGLAVVGRVSPRALWRNVGARAGDRLLLTKPLGTGVITTAIKRRLARPAEIRAVTRVMSTLNRDAATALRSLGKAVHAVTDVTGFGLLGHLFEMLDGSKVDATLRYAAMPIPAAARRLAALDCFAGGTRANLDSVRRRLRLAPALRDDPHAALLLADAQTSGGLLAAVAPSALRRAQAALAAAGIEAAVIGELTPTRRARPSVTVLP